MGDKDKDNQEESITPEELDPLSLQEGGDKPSEQKKKDNITDSDDLEPPDNGPFYCSLCNWYGSFYERFDKPFVAFFTIQALNHGLWIMAILAVKDQFKTYMGLDPGEMQIYMSVIHIPWSFKILYGLISDNVPICGTRRKSYLVIMGILQFLALFVIFSADFEEPLPVAILLCVASMSEAFVNVVADAIMVIQSRKDPRFGSQDFVSLMYIATGVGGVIGCIYGGLMTQYAHPKWVFFTYSWFGLIVTIAACFLTPASEKDTIIVHGEDSASEISTSQEGYEDEQRSLLIDNGQTREQARAAEVPPRDGFCFNLKKNCQAIGRAIMMKEIYFVILFFILKGLINPTFEEFSYFFLMNIIGVSKFIFALLVLIGQVCHLVGALIFRAWCRNVDTRNMLIFAMCCSVLGSLLNYCFAKRWNLEVEIDDMFFLIFTDVIFNVLSTLLFTLPILSLFAKITPPKIEGTIFAFLTGTLNFQGTVIAPAVGTWINYQFVGVNKKDLSNYNILVLVQLCGAILSFALIPLIPNKEMVREQRALRQEEHQKKNQDRRDRRKKKNEDQDAADRGA